jgi:hypothetical protein
MWQPGHVEPAPESSNSSGSTASQTKFWDGRVWTAYGFPQPANTPDAENIPVPVDMDAENIPAPESSNSSGSTASQTNERNLPINSNEEPGSMLFQPPTILNLMGAGPDEDPTGALRAEDIPRLMADALLENLRDRQASNRTLPSATPNSRRRQADATLPSVRGAHLRPQEVRGYQEDDAHRTYGNCRDPTCRLELERGLLGECQCGDMVGECGLPVCSSEAAGLRAAPCPHASLPPAGPSCRAAPPRRTAAAER